MKSAIIKNISLVGILLSSLTFANAQTNNIEKVIEETQNSAEELQEYHTKTRTEEYVSELVRTAMNLINAPELYKEDPEKRERELFSDYIKVHMYSVLLKIDKKTLSASLEQKLSDYLDEAEQLEIAEKENIDYLRKKLEIPELSDIEKDLNEEDFSELDNFDNAFYWHEKLFKMYSKNPVNMGFKISTASNKQDPYMIKQKLSTHLGDLITFSSDSKKLYPAELEIVYTVMKGNSLKIANPLVGEYKPNEEIIRIDTLYKDNKLKIQRKNYVEGNITELSYLLDRLSMYIIRDIVLIDDIKD